MTIEDKIGDENLQYYVNREAAKISAPTSNYLIIKDEQQNKPNLHILLQEKLLRIKQKTG